ncbi:MAG TPA: low temperature requirement protein A [Propionicimonas sp.]|uniref:low temperature requirement protein A n=1 Tax=Propionicimonas sp. TaxID=1955623 RepID=UPI002F42A291
MVAGYIVMRVAMLAQWVRVARQDPDRRRVAIAFVVTIAIAQVGWTVLALLATCCSDTAGAPGVGPTAAS